MRPLPLLAILATSISVFAQEPVSISGIYPHLAMFNNEGECGTGAVVPWADKLWVITYGPHLPFGSSDKLYEISQDLKQTVRPESVGGTPANRMIHRESNQLFIGPYAVNAQGGVRVIPPKLMPGRMTGNARHLTDPAGKIFYATMEEGLYEVDVKTLAVTGLIKDGNAPKPGQTEEVHPAKIDSKLPGYHGKGLFSGQGRVVYANNGDRDKRVITDPTTPSGALGEWRKPGDDWQLVRRNQFTEVTGPGGIYGNEKPDTDPIWSIGWDHRSLIFMLLDGGKWQSFRLPKGSHSYDGAHGWNTEWPRIREIGENELLMTMHGTFWKFPKTFSSANTAGISARSTYLKVIGDFARWGDRLVLGCDDTAKSEFLNKRKVKGHIEGPGQSQSNLWFIKPEQLDQLGPIAGHGAVWLDDAVKAGEASDPFLFAGYPRRSLHLSHDTDAPVVFTIETNDGTGEWKKLREVTLPARGYQWIAFTDQERGAWVRLKTDREATNVTADFHCSAKDERPAKASDIFAGLAAAEAKDYSAGLIRTRGENLRNLSFAASTVKANAVAGEAYYELDAALKLTKVDDAKALAFVHKAAEIPRGVISSDAASVLVVDDAGRRWRLPKGATGFDAEGALPLRVSREVATERDLFQAHGTFFELPAENAGGFAKMRPVVTHGRRIVDYCSYRGLLVLSGIAADAPANNPHVIRSEDGQASLWVGVVDDLWKAGRATGEGGPWKDTEVEAAKPSDPYLIASYENKKLTLSHDSKEPVTFTVEVDFLGTGFWKKYQDFTVAAGQPTEHVFPEGYSARWVRVTANKATKATATLRYD